MHSPTILCVLLAALAAPGASRSDASQGPSNTGRLQVTVVDQTGGVIPSSRVVVTPGTPDNPRGSAREALTSGVGQAIFDDLPEGRYTIETEFPGFEPAAERDVRVRAGGETRRRLVLHIKRLDESVTVARDKQSSALDPRGSAFSSVLTREQIDALPDDPDEMETALKSLAPPGSVIRVDGFTGGRLPPKSQIRSIRLPRMDMFAAQNHGGMMGMVFIDIMTQPGNGPLRGNVDFNFMDDVLNATNVFTSTKPAEQMRQGAWALSGTLRPNRTSFSLSGSAGTQYTSPNLLAVLPDGTTTTETMRQPRDSYNIDARLDHALTRDHALRAAFGRESSSSRNLGVGGYNLFDRAFRTDASTNLLRLSENGPLGRRFFSESRLQLKWSKTDSQSAVEAPAIRVQDAFTSGGAQQRGGQRGVEFEMASDLDFVRGLHSWRAGVLVEGARWRSDEFSNYLGTYTFANLDEYRAGHPLAYSRRIGDPSLRYATWQAATYLQDDWRVSRSVLLSPGVRVGVQDHVGDRWNVSPRLSAAWSPRRDGSVTLRASYGDFYDWVSGDVYKQSRQVDGQRQRELNIVAPTYPDPGSSGTTPLTNRYAWDSGITLPSAQRLVLGVEKTLGQNTRLSATFGKGWGRGLLRGQNLNAPVNGIRPDPSVANLVTLADDAASRSTSFGLMASYLRPDWHRFFLVGNYSWSRATSNTAGAFTLPAGPLDDEWGPVAGDIRHRAGASLSASPFKNLSLGLNVRAQSGLPYTVTTGRDENGDGVFNDRPTGIGRNTARGAAQWDVGGRLSYAWGFGTPRQATGGPGGVQVAMHVGGAGSGPGAGFSGGATDKRYRIEAYMSGQNLLNRTNYTAYSFVMTSPFFGQPIAASQPRKLQVGLRFAF